MNLKSFLSIISGVSTIFFSCSNKINEFKVAPIFSNHMVLQQNTDVPIWGVGSPGENIEIITSWGKVYKKNISENGIWDISIKTPKHGGPYEVKIVSDKKEIILEDVLIGEVWITSGQSNMEWPMWARIINQEEEIKNANFSNIRMFNVPRNLNGININNSSWKVTTPENVADFSAVGYFFAREIHQKLGVPVGIINSSWGGTRVEAWTSIEKLEKMKETSQATKQIIKKGGLKNILDEANKLNIHSRKKNEIYLKEKSYPVPQSFQEWQKLDLNDIYFSNSDYEDDLWSVFNHSPENNFFTYESVFENHSLEESGVLWIRKEFDLEKPNEYTNLIIEGVNDFDYTYINGKPIGSELACCINRNYEIPNGLLRKRNNLLAIRIIDYGGKGGLKGPIYLKANNNKKRLDSSNLKFKHTAFLLNHSIQAHKISTDKFLKESSIINDIVEKGINIQDPNRYSILYNTMIKPLIPFKVKGFLWYQGESNVNNYFDYKNLFTGMILDWREKWKSNLPFYYVQIAPFLYSDNENGCGDCLSYLLRDAQRKTLDLEKTGMAITLDIGEKNDIHPANKQDVGKRLARLALNNDYGMKEVLASGPLYKSKKLYKTYIDLTFDYVGSGLNSRGLLNGFEIAGPDNVFYSASAKIINEKVRVYSKKVIMPKRVRYGWKNYFDATLFNSEGIPASSFQTE